MKTYAFGVDLGGTTVKIGLFRTDGELLEKWEIPTRKEDAGSRILPDIAEAVLEKARERRISLDEVEGIGMGVPGPVREDGMVLRCVNLGWGVFNAEEELARLTGLRVRCGNDANVAAMGEKWQGSGKEFDNMVMITLGTGVGGGIIIGGKILSGTHGAGGEIGHMTVNPDETETCGCGKKGCLEQYASATGVVRLAKRYLSAGDDGKGLPDAAQTTQSALCGISDLTCKDVFDAAKKGDAAAAAIIEEFGQILGKACSWIACVTDPDVFVIGGGVSKAGTIVTDIVRKYYTLYAFHACAGAEFRLAALGNDAGIYGGVGLLLS